MSLSDHLLSLLISGLILPPRVQEVDRLWAVVESTRADLAPRKKFAFRTKTKTKTKARAGGNSVDKNNTEAQAEAQESEAKKDEGAGAPAPRGEVVGEQ